MTSRSRLCAAVLCVGLTACADEPPVVDRFDAEVVEQFVETPPDASVWIDAQSFVGPRDGGRPDAALPVTGPLCAIDKVDLLLVLDNSGSMAEEQKKLANALPGFLGTLTAGAIKSLHVGVVSSDMGVAGVQGLAGCGQVSFDATAPDPTNPAARAVDRNAVRFDKPRGDDGIMNISTAVALAGISARPAGTSFDTPITTVVAPDPSCAAIGALPPGQRFVDFTAGSSDPSKVAKQVGCIAKLGVNGCGMEQPLEAMLKALTPSSSGVAFAGNTAGHGDSLNRSFLRSDAILVVLHVSDEDDCSITTAPLAAELFNPASTVFPEELNVRCGLSKYQPLLHSVAQRYVAQLKALHSDSYLQARTIVAGIVGVPTRAGKKVYEKYELDALLKSQAMQLTARAVPGTQSQELTPACTSSSGSGSAIPARRFVQLANEMGISLVSSVCEDEFSSALGLLAQKVLEQTGFICTVP